LLVKKPTEVVKRTAEEFHRAETESPAGLFAKSRRASLPDVWWLRVGVAR